MTPDYQAVIEIPKGDDRRRHLNYAKTAIEDFGPIKEVIPVNDGVMPVAYGYLENTLNQDEGDEVDVLIFSSKNFAVGEKVAVIPIGLLMRADRDHKVLAVDQTPPFKEFTKWEDIEPTLRELILKYFGHKHKIEEIADATKALEYLEQTRIK